MALRASAVASKPHTPPKAPAPVRAPVRGSAPRSRPQAVAERAMSTAVAPQQSALVKMLKVTSVEPRPISRPLLQPKETVKPISQPLRARVTVHQPSLAQALEGIVLVPGSLNLVRPGKKKISPELKKEEVCKTAQKESDVTNLERTEKEKLIELYRTAQKERHETKTSKKQNPSFLSSFLSKVTQPKNLCILGAVVALKTAFAVLAVKFGPMAATHLVAQQTVAFLSPGLYVVGLALEIALKTATTIIVHGMLPIVLPILSTIVVTTLAVAMTAYVGYLLANALLDAVPGGGVVKSLLGKIFKAVFSKEQPKPEQAPKSAIGSVVNYFTGSKADEVTAVKTSAAKSDSAVAQPRLLTRVRPKPMNPLLMTNFRL